MLVREMRRLLLVKKWLVLLGLIMVKTESAVLRLLLRCRGWQGAMNGVGSRRMRGRVAAKCLVVQTVGERLGEGTLVYSR